MKQNLMKKDRFLKKKGRLDLLSITRKLLRGKYARRSKKDLIWRMMRMLSE